MKAFSSMSDWSVTDKPGSLRRARSFLIVEGVEFGNVGPTHYTIDLYSNGYAVCGEFKQLCVFYNLHVSEYQPGRDEFYQNYIDNSMP